MTYASSHLAQDDLYDILGLASHASPDEIEAAYRRQRALYDPSHGAAMGDEFAEHATEQRAKIEQAYTVLSNPQHRFDYDKERGLVGDEVADRKGISNREVMFTIVGVLIGLLILSLAYNLFAGKSQERETAGRFSTANIQALPIQLRTLQGSTFDLSQQRGKVVVINFWGTWCDPCKEETPALQAAYQKLHDQGLEIVGVNLFDQERSQYNHTEQHVQAFAQQYGVTYPIALDETGDVARAYQLYPLPTSLIVDPDGNVRYSRIGKLTTEDVEYVFRQLQRP